MADAYTTITTLLIVQKQGCNNSFDLTRILQV